MAGAGYKLFNTGDVLTAAQVNTYLMEQTVMVFADAAARTTALSGVVSEGMISYLKDTNAVEVYDGSNWVSSDDPNAIQNTIVDAKGDLITATASDVPARLAVGNNGETLVADSSATTGLRYQPLFGANKNKIINGDFNIWQRGTSVAVPANNVQTFQADRFWAQHNGTTNGTITYARQTFTVGQTDVPYNPTYFARVTNTTLGTSQTQTEFGQSIEDVSTFAGQTATFSFYVKASGTFTLSGFAWQNFGSGGSTGVFTTLTLSTSTTTTSWQRVTATLTVPSISGKTVGTGNYIAFYVRMVSPTAGSTIDFANWQVEAGSVATAFQTATGTLAGELQAAQRYLPAHYVGNSTLGIIGQATGTGTAYYTAPFAVQPRVAPTGITISSGTLKAGTSTFGDGGGTGVFNSAQLSQGQIIVTGASGLTAGHATYIYPSATATILWTGCEL